MYYYGREYGQIGREGNGGGWSPNPYNPSRTEPREDERRSRSGERVLINGVYYTIK